MPDMRPDSQLSFLTVTQLACPANLACSLLQRLVEYLGKILPRKARELLQDNLLKLVLDGVVTPVDVGGPGGACFGFLLLHICVDFSGHRDTDLLLLGVDDEINALVGGLGLLAAVGRDVDVAFGDKRISSRKAAALHGWLVCHCF